nr:unnamed protein product [Digitaria exilis]
MSFWKHEPPKPTLAERKCGPMRASLPTEWATCATSAPRGDGVDGGDALGEEGVGGELGELGGPEVGGEDAVGRDPPGVDVAERGDGGEASGGVVAAADEDAVRGEEVGDGGALGEELGIREDLVADASAAAMAAVGVVGEDLLDGLGGLDGDGGLLDHDLVGDGDVGDHPRRGLPVGEVGGLAGAEAAGLGGGVDGDEDDVRVGHVAVDLRAEGEN